MNGARFELGQCKATQGALGALEDNGQYPIVYLHRHAGGDWGELSDHDKAMNEAAITDGSQILSKYKLPDGQHIYVITDAADKQGERTHTTVLLPEEY
jgi:hypothetical protein